MEREKDRGGERQRGREIERERWRERERREGEREGGGRERDGKGERVNFQLTSLLVSAVTLLTAACGSTWGRYCQRLMVTVCPLLSTLCC